MSPEREAARLEKARRIAAEGPELTNDEREQLADTLRLAVTAAPVQRAGLKKAA